MSSLHFNTRSSYVLGIFPELERNNSSMNTGTIPHLLWTHHICCCQCWSDCARPNAKRPETSTKLKKVVNGKQTSIRNVLTEKTGITFQNFRLSRQFSSGTNQKKNIYHLHPNRNFREFVVDDKQPDSHQTISRRSSECWLLIGHKKCFVLLCPIGEQHLLIFLVSSYTTAIDSITACLAHAPKQERMNTRSQETFSLI